MPCETVGQAVIQAVANDTVQIGPGEYSESVTAPGTKPLAFVGPAAGPPAAEPGCPAGVAAAVCAALGVPLTLFSDAGAALALGIVLLLAAVAAAAIFVVPNVALGDKGDASQ